MQHINKYSNYLFKIILLLIIIFISSDIFLTIEISEATIRFSSILFFVLFILWIIYFSYLKQVKIPMDKTFLPLLIFCFLSFISSTNSIFPLKSLIYSLWTVFSALTIVFLLWFSRSDSTDNLDWLLKIYFYSFFVISIFGIYQILLPFLIGEKTPFVTQWLQRGTLARINALSYEPSYFATYLIMGCFIWFILWVRENDIVKFRGIILLTVLVVVFLSSSRIGWLGIVMIIAYGLIGFIGYYLMNKKATTQNMKFFIYFIIILLFAIVSVLVMFNNKDKFDFLFEGTGLFDTADYSYSIRNDKTLDTFEVFLDKPSNFIIGVGPGGVGAYLVNNPESFEKLWATEPNNFTAEILASVGILGFASFAWFLVNVFKRLWNLYANNNLLKKYRTVCLALLWGLALELIMLQFNQNYLMPYLWLNIGISISKINLL